MSQTPVAIRAALADNTRKHRQKKRQMEVCTVRQADVAVHRVEMQSITATLTKIREVRQRLLAFDPPRY